MCWMAGYGRERMCLSFSFCEEHLMTFGGFQSGTIVASTGSTLPW